MVADNGRLSNQPNTSIRSTHQHVTQQQLVILVTTPSNK
jgi:hypothetical protein